MTSSKTRLELAWIGKDQRPRLEPRVLVPDASLSYRAPGPGLADSACDNLLVHGDNLLALRALEQRFTGTVKCVYIDPPYNTGSAFAHYDDGLEHSIWLSLMRDRLELLRTLLRPDGVLFVSIDDTELAYLIVLLDEVFGRGNSCGMFVWEKKKKPSFLNSNMGIVTEYVLSYAKDRSRSPAFIGGLTTVGKKYPLNNAGNGIKVLEFPAGGVSFRCGDRTFAPQDMSEGNIVTELMDRLEVRGGRNVASFRLRGEWRYSQARVDEIIAAGETIVISRDPFRPNHVKDGGEPKKLKNLLSIAHQGMSTYEDATAESRSLFGERAAFDYPKPEKLIATLVAAVTEEGDWVLDSFAGSGTTGAVAHKMGRRWIMVELGDHCHTHIVPRLKKVVDGTDRGGISESTGWKGGGGFRYFRLAPSLLERDKWGNWVVSREYNSAMLAEAMCKLEGFRYEPDVETFWIHGRSTERDFLYVTTQTLTRPQLVRLSEEVGPNRTLLVCCGAFRGGADDFENLTVRKIPQGVLHRCEWGRDDYSLNVANPPAAGDVSDAAHATAGRATQRIGRREKKPAADAGPSLFDAERSA